MSSTVSIIYASFSRILWSFLFAWPIYCLHYGFVPDGLYRFTCSGFFKPMARINLTVLFMNEIIIRMRNATQIYIADPTFFNTFISIGTPVIVFTYALSFIVSSMVDGPSISLVKSYLKKDGKYDEYLKKPNVNLNNNLISSTQLEKESSKKD
uniref:Uncharacterized protein n=2 Tax=Tetranychus urticae TaxID=32264 RepID=T1KBF3_TETUR